MTSKKYFSVGMLLLMSLMLASSVSAFAVSSPYWPDNPLRISPGETKDFQIVLQNNAGTQDVTVKASVREGAEVVSIADASDVYIAPAGGSAIVNLRASVPADSEIGGDYSVVVSFNTVTSGNQGGNVALGSAIDQKIPVFVVEKPKVAISIGASNWTIYLVAAIVILVIAIILVKRKK